MWNETAWKVIVDQSDAVEFDWYGVDQLGHVAVFSSFGRGAIPNVVKTCRTTYKALYDFIEALPECTGGKLVYSGGGRYDDWIAYSRRGLFGYDYQDAHRDIPLGQYDLLTVPESPIRLADLDIPCDLLAIIPMVDVHFGADAVLPFDVFPR